MGQIMWIRHKMTFLVTQIAVDRSIPQKNELKLNGHSVMYCQVSKLNRQTTLLHVLWT